LRDFHWLVPLSSIILPSFNLVLIKLSVVNKHCYLLLHQLPVPKNMWPGADKGQI